VTGARNNEKFFGLTGKPVGILTELSGMRVFTRDEKHRTRGNRLNVIERVEIHELNVAGQRRVRGEFGRRALGSAFASRSAVEIIKLTLNGVSVFI
jgi:hypothetical protein